MQAIIYPKFSNSPRLHDDWLIFVQFDAMSPGEELFFEMFELPHSGGGSKERLGQRIEIEVTGDDVKVDRLTLEYASDDELGLIRLTRRNASDLVS